MEAVRQVCAFYVGDHYCGVDAEHVQEVITTDDVTPIPLMPAELRGLVNLRGQIVPVIDTHRLFEIDGGATRLHMVLRSGADQISFLVDRVDDVMSLGGELFEEIPATLTGRIRDYLEGTYKLEGRLLLMFDSRRLADITLGDLGGRG